MRRRVTCWMLAVLLAGATPVLARDAVGNPLDELGDDYAAGDYGRVRDAENGLTILRSDWDHEGGVTDEGDLNSPVFPGDRITTGGDQRVEVELAGGTLVWIDRATDMTFLSLPEPYAEIADNTVLQLARGRMRVSASLGEDDEIRVDTPAASVYPVGDADVRIAVEPDGRTRVESRRGVVEVVGSGGSVLLRSGTHTEVAPGLLPYDPAPFNTFSGDGLDRYVAERQEAYRYRDGYGGGPEVYRELPRSVQPYYRELSTYGNWFYTDEYGYVWQPSGLAADWRPYHDGYWAYGPGGYFWVSHEPWGWAPYHYGRWSWVGSFGWCWSPGRIFAGAWVSWSWGSVYVGWSPLDYWNCPPYRSAWYYGYYDPFCWTFVSYHHIHHRHYARYSVGWGQVSHHVHRNAVVTRPPRVAPGKLASSASAREQALREVRDDRGRALTARERARPERGSSFRSGETRLPSASRRADRRDATVRAPEGRARTIPPTRRSRESLPDRRSAERGGRERLPVATAPRNRSVPQREAAGRSASPGREQSLAPGARPRPEASSADSRTERQGTAERVRDLYRRMSEPRTTRDRPSASSRSDTSREPRASSSKSKTPRTPRTRTTPSEPSRSRSEATKPSRTPTKQVRPRSRSGDSSKSTPPRRDTSRPDTQLRSTERSATTVPSRTERRTRVSTPRPTRESSVVREPSRIRSPSSAASGSPGRNRSSPSISRPAPSRRPTPSVKRSSPSRRSAPSAVRSTPRIRSGGSKAAPRAGGRSRPSRSSSRGGGRR